METKTQDAIFSEIDTQFGEATLKAAKRALIFILKPAHPDLALKPRAARAARYLHRLAEDKTEALHAIYMHLRERAASGLKIPRRGLTLLSQMVSADKLATGRIIIFGFGGLERVAGDRSPDGAADGAADGATEGEGEGEGDGDGAADADAEGDECEDAGAKAACIYNSGAADDDFCQGELLPVSKNEFRAATKTAAELLGLTPWGLKDFRSSLKSIPRASLRAYSQHANIASIDCYLNP